MTPRAKATPGRLVVVSNRVALPRQTTPGGLASALQAALLERGGLWFGWSGKLAAATGAEVHHQRSGNVEYATIDLSRADQEEVDVNKLAAYLNIAAAYMGLQVRQAGSCLPEGRGQGPPARLLLRRRMCSLWCVEGCKC